MLCRNILIRSPLQSSWTKFERGDQFYEIWHGLMTARSTMAIALVLFQVLCLGAGSATPGKEEGEAMDKSAAGYTIRKTEHAPILDEGWDGASWETANTLTIDHWYPSRVKHRPKTQAKVLYSDQGLYVMFRVEDRYVRAVRTKYQDFVANDSCVEFFVRPQKGKGYFNFEMNCIGTLLLFYVEDPRVVDGDFAKYEKVPEKLGRLVERYHSLSGVIVKEIQEAVTWVVAYHIPWKVFDPYVGPVKDLRGRSWAGNFYKCADECSRPHWGAWSPIGAKLSFHQPDRFGVLTFE